MNRLSYRVFLLFLPLIVCIFLFGYGYFLARQSLMLEHIAQASKIAVAQSADYIRFSSETSVAEFDEVSSQIQQCSPQQSENIANKLANALSFSSGFSALFLSDLNGRATQFVLSANPSNRYVLRREIKGKTILSNKTLLLLRQSFTRWQIDGPKREAQQKQLLEKLSALNARGEENSFSSRELTQNLVQIRRGKHLPKAIATLADESSIAKLGLIYHNSTYFFSRPLIDCEQNLSGFYTVVLDRTLLDQQLLKVKQSFREQGIQSVDIAIVRNRDQHIISSTHYLNPVRLKKFKLNDNEEPILRRDLGGMLTNQNVVYNLTQDLIFQFRYFNNPTNNNDKTGISVALFVDANEIERETQVIRHEVSIYIMITMALFIVLLILLSRIVTMPIVKLQKQVNALSAGFYPHSLRTERNDEIGRLLNAFEDMTNNLRIKERQLIKLSQFDPLTNIFNRRALMDAVNIIAAKQSQSSAILMLDLDNFKSINDKYGHACGDDVLINVANLIKNEIRSSDIFGRMGGEEFTVVLPDTNLETSLRIAERIRKSVELNLGDVLIQYGPPAAITVSIGVSMWQDGNFSKALAKADKHLYQAKHSGRNQVVYQGEKR
ncbi:diguanylate cyclase [Vibrio brasiliensis]|uniref:diguanylate cyclase n=1 Tax=Vibrio brasiliensis TaxID=170652 RepID=UPI001EFD8815|nr:diguanylate cyclase [Vibrio brasiliensis]MCG9726370.1 diguanylate cyclase [Vibrio brasiliensis]